MSQRTWMWIALLLLAVAGFGLMVLWRRALRQLAVGTDADHRVGRDIRRRMGQLTNGSGPLHDPSDTKQLVLQAAISLLGADRGLLLGRDDADGDGNLDVICAVGYEERDPQKLTIVQRVGGETLDRDTTLREGGAVAMPVYIADEFDGALVCEKDRGDFADFDDEVLLALGDHAGAVLGNSRLQNELRTAYVGTVRSLADAIEAKDPAVRTHSEEVARYVSAVAARLELDPERREQLLFASLLHDVGKIGISERILLKPARLTDEEVAIVRLHPRIGHRIVAAIPALAPLAPAVLHHHERYDGSGYPNGLEGERIPLEARIVGVADSFSAMIEDRPYAAGRSPEEACAELERCAGSQFDPRVVEAFVAEVRAAPPKPLQDDPLDTELDVHRNGTGPLGSPAYALVDNLTLLHSRGFLHELVEAEARRAGVQGVPFGLVVAAVEQLEAVNRRDGFAAGDRLLLEVADTFRGAERLIGGTACRVAGNRFALVLPAHDAGLTQTACLKLKSELDGGPACTVTAITWQEGEDGFAVLERARRELGGAPVQS